MDVTGLAGVAAAVLLVARLLIAGVFIRAGAVKLTDLAEFRLAVTNYGILPASLIHATAALVPALELMAGLLLLIGVFPGVVAAVLAALLLCFSAAIAVNLARGRVFDCGCGGTAAPQLISWRHVAINGLLAFAAAAISITSPGGLDLLSDPRGAFPIGIPGGSGVPVVLAAALCLVTARMVSAALTARELVRDRGASESADPG